MKKLIMTTAMYLAAIGGVFSQTYLTDYQEQIGVPGESLKNYTLCEIEDNGFAFVSFLEANGSLDQNNIQVFLTDSDLNVTLTQRFEYNALGLWGFEITPNDIYQTEKGDFIIAGGMINEGDPGKSGGFLLLIDNIDNEKLEFGWMQIYPSEDLPDITPMRSLTRVVDTEDGFMAIGRSESFLTNGIVMHTDSYGNVNWAKHLFDEEYEGVTNSVLNDMVSVSPNEVAIVGTVNGFPQDDADINVIRISDDGVIVMNNVYEYLYEPKDREFTYLEYGAAIEFDKDRKELVVAGTVTKKLEGVCVEGEYKNILTFGIDYNTGYSNWSTRHDIGADPVLANESIFCADIDFSGEDYGIAGTVSNRSFGESANYNGFILRLDNAAISTDLRFYGQSQDDFLSRIYSKVGKYIAGGQLMNGSDNHAWLIESFNSILEECNSKFSDPETREHPLLVKKGLSEDVDVPHKEDVMKAVKTTYKPVVLCERDLVKRGATNPGVPMAGLALSDLSKVYPIVIKDGKLIIENNSGLVSYYIMAVNGSLVSQPTNLVNGRNTISVDHLDKGMYLVVGQNEFYEKEIFKVIVD